MPFDRFVENLYRTVIPGNLGMEQIDDSKLPSVNLRVAKNGRMQKRDPVNGTISYYRRTRCISNMQHKQLRELVIIRTTDAFISFLFLCEKSS